MPHGGRPASRLIAAITITTSPVAGCVKRQKWPSSPDPW